MAREVEQIFCTSNPLTGQQKQHLSELVGAIRQQLNRSFSLAPSARITIVAEDSAILAEVTNFLTPWGIEVTTLADPLQFWATRSATSPDLLILDVAMSGISGLELCQIVRKDFHRVQLPVLLNSEAI